jgi:predicted transposase YdaD
MAVLWLRFLREIEDQMQEAPADLLESEEIKEALSLCEQGAFSTEELEVYDQYWDRISTEKGLNDQARSEGEVKGEAKGRAEGLAEGLAEGETKGRVKGRAEGLAEGEAKGRAQELERIILSAYQNRLPIEQIRAFSGLSNDDIMEILERNKAHQS